MSLSATWDAEPKSHNFKMVFDSFTFTGEKQTTVRTVTLSPSLTRMKASHYQDVVRLDVGVEDVASLEQLEGQEELLAVGTHRLDVEPHVFAVFLQHLSQIHAEGEERTNEELN